MTRMKTLASNKDVQAAAILIIVLVIVYRDIVFLGRTFLIETADETLPTVGPFYHAARATEFVANDPGAIAWQTQPITWFLSSSIKKGDFPLWNPYAGLAGSPLFADGYTGPLEPIQFLFFFFPGQYWPYAVDLQLLIRFFIAGYCCYLFARRQQLSFLGSVSAGALFMLCSYFMTYGNHPEIKSESLLPLVLYGYDRLADLEYKPWFWFCALAIGWLVMAAMPESIFFVLFLGSLWYFYKSFVCGREPGKFLAQARAALFKYLGSTGLGFLIASVYLFPLIEYLSVSYNVHAAEATASGFPFWALSGLVLASPYQRDLSLGFFAIFCLVICLLHFKQWREYHLHIIFFGSYATLFTFTIFDFPLTNWVHGLPVLNQVVLYKYPMPSIVFCLAILAGIFVDRAGQRLVSTGKILWSFLIVPAIYVAMPIVANLGERPYQFFIGNTFVLTDTELIIGIAIVLVVLFQLHEHGKMSPRLLQIGLLIILVAEPVYWSTNIKRPERVSGANPYPALTFTSYLQKANQPFRIFGLDGTLFPNVSTAYGLADIRWLNALIPQRAFDFSTQFINSNEPSTMRLTGTAFPVSDAMFDLLNVKYVIAQNSSTRPKGTCTPNSDTQPSFGQNAINELILTQNPDAKTSDPERIVNIGGATRIALLAQAPRDLSVKLDIPPSATILQFSIGLDPSVFQPKYGDGVTFKIEVLDGTHQSKVFSKYIDPKNNPCDRSWFDEQVDLAAWSGKTISLDFVTDPGPAKNNTKDLAYWGSIGLAAMTRPIKLEQNSRLYQPVYQDQNTVVYQNENVMPRAFMAYQVVNVSNPGEALTQLANPQMDLRQTAIVENLPAELAGSLSKNTATMPFVAGTATLISSGELDVTVNTETAGLLVVTDQYYPGWEASVDGQQVSIYAVDETFRGVFLNPGNHMIKFAYKPLSFLLGGILSIISILFALTLFVVNFRAYQNQND